MKRLLLPLLGLLATLSLNSCFQSETTVHLNKDGSGTIVEETCFTGPMLEMLGQLSALGGENAEAKDPTADLVSEDKAKERATKLGEGVSFDKVEKIDTKTRKGGRVTYKFADINKLKLSSDGGASQIQDSLPTPEEAKEAAKKAEPITFAYANGKLSVKIPHPEGDKKKENPAPEAGEPGEEEMAQAKKMFADMRMSLKIVADGGIAESDATHIEGNTVTIFEMDFGKIVNNDEAFKKLKEANPESPEAMKEAFKGVDGVKVEEKKEVSITLK